MLLDFELNFDIERKQKDAILRCSFYSSRAFEFFRFLRQSYADLWLNSKTHHSCLFPSASFSSPEDEKNKWRYSSLNDDFEQLHRILSMGRLVRPSVRLEKLELIRLEKLEFILGWILPTSAAGVRCDYFIVTHRIIDLMTFYLQKRPNSSYENNTGQTYGRTDLRREGPTDRWTYGRTDRHDLL